jgi:NAD(P)H-hydrate repair Nnr-like enzyme with NAD(P)H-hydrate dehydratase domain
VTILLKGSRTLVANENVLYELPPSTPWLATAGSGDVLAGIIGSIVTTNTIEILNDANRLAEVAATGALIHLLAAEKTSNGGPISAQQIIPKISEVIAKVI